MDVDGTLDINGDTNKALVTWCMDKKAQGFSLVLWSAQGEAYAKRKAESHKVTDLFDYIISKPGYIVDDKGWHWIKFTKVINLKTIARLFHCV